MTRTRQTFTVKLDVNNIGPHTGDRRIRFIDNVDSNNAIYFAPNGTGKSFISRAFRLMEEEELQNIDNLLTIDQASGGMSFSIINSGAEKKLSISLSKGSAPSIDNNTGLIFHVFNSDFVEENIKPKYYTLDGKIEGYILGKAQIDLTDELRQEGELIQDCKDINRKIDECIEEAKQELRRNGVSSLTKEFGLITKDRLRKCKEFGSSLSFDAIIAQLEALSKAPEKLADIKEPSLNIDQSIFNEIATLLTTRYPKTEWDEEFVTTIKTGRIFIEKGLELSGDGDVCPFCKQAYQADALALIDNYKVYLADREAELARKLETCETEINKIFSALNGVTRDIKAATADIAMVLEFFPSLDGTKLMVPELDAKGIAAFRNITKMLQSKAADLSKIFPETYDYVSLCKGISAEFEAIVECNEQIIRKVNEVKEDSAGERLSLRRQLCEAQFERYRGMLAPLFLQQSKIDDNLGMVQESIIEKREKSRASKRDRVYETLTFFLNSFFAGKYSLDRDTFQIKFLGSNVGERASSILSDGEKGIVAFCLFLASTHILVDREEDYDRLFFIIDDPISSMDFHYVYAVAQSLRKMKEVFGITTHVRIWVFTHNMEFLSIIARNHILSRVYMMKPGAITRLQHELLMPYANHLKDIVEIATGSEKPSHTTGNSIRHVLETVSRFEYPKKSLDKYISENSLLAQNACIYTLCQDLSHGGVRNQQPFCPEVLVAACQAIVVFMKQKYEGQINALPL